MVTFDDITRLFSQDLGNNSCVEIGFCAAELLDYQNCWMGKMPDSSCKGKEIYWFGLASDGSKAYEYNNFADFSSAPVFGGKSLKDIWNNVELFSIDGCDPESRISDLIP